MENIIRRARRDLAITQREVALRANMSPQAVMRYEQGLYENLSIKLRDAIAELTDLTGPEVDTAYHEWRGWKQGSEWKHFVTPPPLVINGTHPFRHFREGITSTAVGTKSRMAFCILLALHPATVQQYDEGKVKHMPALIRRGLERAQLDATYLKSLIEFGEIWYERNNS